MLNNFRILLYIFEQCAHNKMFLQCGRYYYNCTTSIVLVPICALVCQVVKWLEPLSPLKRVMQSIVQMLPKLPEPAILLPMMKGWGTVITKAGRGAEAAKVIKMAAAFENAEKGNVLNELDAAGAARASNSASTSYNVKVGSHCHYQGQQSCWSWKIDWNGWSFWMCWEG